MTVAPSDNSILTAAAWLAGQPSGNSLLVSDLRQRFGLSAKEACEAIALARRSKVGPKPEGAP